MKDFIIRKAETKDAKQYVELNNLVWRDAYKHIFPEEVFLDRESRAKYKIENFDSIYYNNHEGIAYVAEDDGRIVAIMLGRILSDYEYFRNQGYADLQALYVHPDFQGNGLAGKMKNIFIDWAKENGVEKFVIGVLKDNKKARIVYEKWGGKLEDFSQPFVMCDKGYEEVFYTYEI